MMRLLIPIYYFDEEGMPTDTTDKVVPSAIPNRLYGAKLFIEAPQVAPTTDGTLGTRCQVGS